VLAVAGLEFDGEIRTGSTLRATTPIVNAVFFDSASAVMPDAYRRDDSGHTIPSDPVAAHNDVLVRIARVVKANPGGRIELLGSTSGTTEAEGLPLAQRRANAVKDAFVALGVGADRITVRSQLLPRVASNQDFPEGRAENRRVDVLVREAPLQEWVSAAQFVEVEGRLRVNVTSTGTERVTLRLGGRDTVVPAQSSTVVLPLLQTASLNQSVLSLSLQATSGDRTAIADTTIALGRLPRREVSLRTDEFQAVLRFDYNSADLTDDVKGLLLQLAERLPSGATIVIKGSTDVLGSDQRNRELSTQRARNTEQYIRSVSGDRFVFSVDTTTEKFSDDTPQGRFLNRSIRITVR
jgi:outer membrane protein OmpA-like peptidoglycan-associated protein